MKTIRKFVEILLSAMIMLTSFSMTVIPVDADNPASAVTHIYTLVNDEKVYVLDAGEEGCYLFLPGEADAGNIHLYSENDKQIMFKNGDDLSETIDITSSIDNESNIYETDLLVSDLENSDLSETCHLFIMKGSNIGSFYYKSNDSEKYGIDWIETSRENRGTGTALFSDAMGKVIYEGKIDDIHIRGTSSIRDPKKGYRIKLAKKTALVGEEKGKKWVLLAMYKDALRISDYIMKLIAKASGDKYAADETLVNLYYDGCYRGVYSLSEKNEIKSNRIDITDMEEYYEENYPDYGETVNFAQAKNKYNNTIQYQAGLKGPDQLGGYLLEMNSNFINMENPTDGFFIKVENRNRFISVDGPEYGSKEAVEYISEYFQEFINAIYGSQDNKIGFNPDTGLFYYDYCDLDSLVNSCLLRTICSEWDSFWKSQYFYKDVNEIMFAGPVWDMDNTFGTGWEVQTNTDYDICTTKPVSGKLIKIPSFRTKLKERYFAHYQSIMASLLGEDDKVPSFMDLYVDAKPNLLMDAVLWPVKFQSGNGTHQWAEDESLDTIAAFRVDWIQKHKRFLDSYFENMNETEEASHIYGDPVYEDEQYHKRVCINCGDALLCEHVWNDGEVNKAPTCTEAGTEERECSVCGEKETRTIDALGHNYGDWKYDGEEAKTHTHICANDPSHKETEPCTFDEGVTVDGVTTYTCKVCGGTYSVKEEGPVKPVVSGITRVYGSNRFGTSYAISEAILINAGNDKHDTVILANGDNFADALAGSYLAAVKGAPIIITRAAKVSEVNAYIRSVLNKGGTIYVLGGTAAVPESSLAGLSGYKIKRLAGNNRYGTNLEILKEAGVDGDTILIATGINYADSLSASATGLPMLLVKGQDSLNDDQIKFLKDNPNKKLIILGGESAVSSNFEKELRKYGEVSRIAGDNRFATSIKIAEYFFAEADTAVLAYGSDFPDGLCGGPLANQVGAPLILTRNDKTDIARPYTKERNITDGYALGGTSVLPDATVRRLFGASDSVKIYEQTSERKSISILFVGNSLTQDGIAYLPYMLRTYYPLIDFRFYMWYKGGYTLGKHYSMFTNNENAEIFSVAENSASWTNHRYEYTMSEVLSENEFDIVCMQEYFNYKQSFKESDLIDWYNCREYISTNYKGDSDPEFITLFHAPLRSSADAVFRMTENGNSLILQKTEADDMIPIGMSVYDALSTGLDSLGDEGHLSPDGTHTQEGLPCLLQTYTAMYWLFDRLDINPSIYGCPMRMTPQIYESINVPGPNLGKGVITGTDKENLLAQEIAMQAYLEGKKFVEKNLNAE